MEVEQDSFCKLNIENNDCVKCFDNYFQYEKEVSEGIIVQTYYLLTPELRIPEKDFTIQQLALELMGNPTGENGLWNGQRRDIDFRFKTFEQGKQFKEKIINYGFFCHTQLNKNGTLVEMPSISTIKNLIQKATQIHC